MNVDGIVAPTEAERGRMCRELRAAEISGEGSIELGMKAWCYADRNEGNCHIMCSAKIEIVFVKEV